jgi:23S rRNA (uracil1939-C5)-methyltransferase
MSPVLRLRVERTVAGGDGLGHLDDGRVVFVPGGLPDEDIAVRLVQSKKDFARGELVEVLAASPARVAPPCPMLLQGCGGCDWQHVTPVEQLALKVAIVREALRRTGRLPDAEVLAGAGVSPWAYRTSMRCSVDPLGRLALRRARSHDDVPVAGCLVAHPLLASFLGDLVLGAVDEVSVRVSAATGERTAWWTPEAVLARSVPADAQIGAAASLVEHVAGVPLRVSAPSFFQSGPEAAALLVDAVRVAGGDELVGARSVLDAYGGVGLFAATVVPDDAEVVVVESSVTACADARVNLAGRRATVFEGPMESWHPRSVDVVIADPARQGLGSEAVGVLAATGASVVVLVSCDPVAMARDAALLASQGYRHGGSTVLDLFPQTHHVEVVTRFERDFSTLSSSGPETAP